LDKLLDFLLVRIPLRLLDRNPQIRFHGFVETGGAAFSDITAAAGFQIFPGSAEGCATSVVTCMRRGVIPVTTPETGVDLGSFGVAIDDASVDGVRRLVRRLREMDSNEFRRRIIDTYIASMDYPWMPTPVWTRSRKGKLWRRSSP
jgi:hypothetical protein